MKILTVNAGSSSLKYQLIEMTDESVLCKGGIERIGLSGFNSENVKHEGVHGEVKIRAELADHTEAFNLLMKLLTDKKYVLLMLFHLLQNSKIRMVQFYLQLMMPTWI